jgi:RNA-binding protein (KH domain)
MAEVNSAQVVKEMIEKIAKTIVDKEDEVKVNLVEGERTAIVELRVNKDEIGKIIGKSGRIVKAMRSLVSAASAKFNKRIILEVPDA